MDQPPQQPAAQPHTMHRFAIGIAIALIIGLFGVLIWCWFYKDHSGTGPAGGGSTSNPAVAGPCTDGTSPTAPEGFTLYENPTLGLAFASPSRWGTVAVATTPMGGVGGHYLVGSFSDNSNVTFGGNATDYIVQGRGGMPTDNPGYLEATGAFYTVKLWTFRPVTGPDEFQSDLYPIAEPSVLKDGCNTKALVTQYPFTEFFGYGYDVARFNLSPDSLYYGVNMVYKNPSAADRLDLDSVIHSFRRLP